MNFFQFTIGNYCAGIILHHPIIPDFTTVVSLLIGLIMSYIIFIHNTKNETVMLILRNIVFLIQCFLQVVSYFFEDICKNFNCSNTSSDNSAPS